MTTILDHVTGIAPLTDAERRNRWRARAGLPSGTAPADHPVPDGFLTVPKAVTGSVSGLTDAQRRDQWRARAGTLCPAPKL